MKESCQLDSKTTLFNDLLSSTKSEKIILSKTKKTPVYAAFL
jgi:hypothetical protein